MAGRGQVVYAWLLSPSLIFTLAFLLLGWIAGHSVTYELVGGDVPSPSTEHHGHAAHSHAADHSHHAPTRGQAEDPMHAYLDVLGPAGGVLLVGAFGLALRRFFRHGSFGAWLHGGGGTRLGRQAALSTLLPVGAFVLVEHLERWAAGVGAGPSTRLLATGVLVQFFVGLLCLALVRLTFRAAEHVIRLVLSRPTVSPRACPGAVVTVGVRVLSLGPMAASGAGRAPPSTLPGLRPSGALRG